MAAPPDDPIRAEVERVLHVLVDLAVVTPVRIATAVPRCLLRRASRLRPLVEPVRVARSMVDVLGASGGAGVVAPSDAPAPDEPAVAVRDAPDVAAHGRADLPIEDYESLASSQVVDRLPTLTPEELRAVQAFETAHRGRRTVLGRVEQLLA
jgi:hypothetical protein